MIIINNNSGLEFEYIDDKDGLFVVYTDKNG